MSVLNQRFDRTAQIGWSVYLLAEDVILIDAKSPIFDSRLHFGVVQYVVGDGAVLDSMFDWGSHSASNVSKDFVVNNLGLGKTDCA